MNEAFFYRLDDAYNEKIYDDNLVEMIRRQLELLSDVVIFTKDGLEIAVDGFKLRCDKDHCYCIDKK